MEDLKLILVFLFINRVIWDIFLLFKSVYFYSLFEVKYFQFIKKIKYEENI